MIKPIRNSPKIADMTIPAIAPGVKVSGSFDCGGAAWTGSVNKISI